MRFSEPAAPEAEPSLQSRDSHVFVRLVRVIVDVEQHDRHGQEQDAIPAAMPRRRQRREELVWNNRVKGWRPAGSARGDEGVVDLVSLFSGVETASEERSVVVRPVVLPVEGGGVRQPVEMAWERDRFCFEGVNGSGETLSVTLGEMRESARDPWARQFVGYVMK